MDSKIKIFVIMIIAAGFIAIAPPFSVSCSSIWQCGEWEKCLGGITARSCYDLNSCSSEIIRAENSNCSLTLPYCYDRRINQDESDTDCGGRLCEACKDGKSCLKDEDCINRQCNNGVCKIEEGRPAPLPAVRNKGAAIVVFVIMGVAMLLFARRVFGGKKETIINPKNRGNVMVIFKKPKKDRWGKFKANLKEYLNSIAPIDLFGFGNLEKEKGLLNKSELKESEHPTKQWMLSNLKEAYG